MTNIRLQDSISGRSKLFSIPKQFTNVIANRTSPSYIKYSDVNNYNITISLSTAILAPRLQEKYKIPPPLHYFPPVNTSKRCNVANRQLHFCRDSTFARGNSTFLLASSIQRHREHEMCIITGSMSIKPPLHNSEIHFHNRSIFAFFATWYLAC